jgi:hypothetical protein
MNILEAEKQLKPCKVCRSALTIEDIGNSWLRATCSNTECWVISKKCKSLEELVTEVNRKRSR